MILNEDKSTEYGTQTSANVRIELTIRQGQYLALIYMYTKINRRAPAETDIRNYFSVSSPTAHQMIVKLQQLGAIEKRARVARSIKVLVAPEAIPKLD